MFESTPNKATEEIVLTGVPSGTPGDDAKKHTSTQAKLERLSRFAIMLDAALLLPGTRVRIGLDPILGLIPGVGDWIGVGLSAWVVVEARRMGARRRTLLRMCGNLVLESTLGVIPIIGDIFDVWFRANQRNVALLRRDLAVLNKLP